ncbi:MAG TPA: hypothetical protein VGG39_08825 [Polyangiaceae bacterium]
MSNLPPPTTQQVASSERAKDLLEIASVCGASVFEAAVALTEHGSRPRAQAYLLGRKAAGLPFFDEDRT